ncbi:voltage-dependent anion channel [Seminavis robusta]|uniref:Voltage-dependent anion channel n=1 Tax=Seminavis robusta TaxID=568900 RepID=A0A9N8HNM7_9STRA|nr:voltage-dependent anion channel [Seminavis robusta]|eukprot:Sro834_g208670.1 voltage-dependent anion channel (266) ;mRNA; r:15794-16800
MATKFGDFSKGPKDLLGDDYSSSISLKCKKPAGPVAVTIETERGGGGALSAKVGTKFAYAGFNVDKGQLKADGSRVLETSVKPCPGCKVSFKAGKGADLCVDYTKGAFYATSVLDVLDTSKISASASMGHPSGFTFGGATVYGLAGKTGFTAYDVGLKYSQGPLLASLTTSGKLGTFNVALKYKVNDEITVASQTAHSSSKTCDVLAIGGLYKAEFGDVKAKIGSNGMFSAVLIKEIAPKVTIKASGAVSTSDFSNFTTGLGIEM